MKIQYKIYFFLLSVIFASLSANAQQNTVMIHNVYEPQLFNPAMIRQQYSSDTLGGRIGDFGIYHRQQIGVTTLRTSYLFLSRVMGGKKKINPFAWGINAYADQNGRLATNKVNLMTGVKLGKDRSSFGIGINLGAINQSVDLNNIYMQDVSDFAFFDGASAFQSVTYNLGFGVNYALNSPKVKLNIGYSASELTGNEIQGINNRPFYNMYANGVANLNLRFEGKAISPEIMFLYRNILGSNNEILGGNADASLRFHFGNKVPFWLAFGGRLGSVTVGTKQTLAAANFGAGFYFFGPKSRPMLQLSIAPEMLALGPMGNAAEIGISKRFYPKVYTSFWQNQSSVNSFMKESGLNTEKYSISFTETETKNPVMKIRYSEKEEDYQSNLKLKDYIAKEALEGMSKVLEKAKFEKKNYVFIPEEVTLTCKIQGSDISLITDRIYENTLEGVYRLNEDANHSISILPEVEMNVEQAVYLKLFRIKEKIKNDYTTIQNINLEILTNQSISSAREFTISVKGRVE